MLTIGAYGYTPDGFFTALGEAGVNLFLDVRQRRGMRGSRYAFANSSRLVPELEARGIEYRHLKELAPTTEIRKLQRAADAATKTTKSQRDRLSDTFVAAYRSWVLDPYDWQTLATGIGDRTPVLFCVERQPAACHRSLVAERLATHCHVNVLHLSP